MDTESAPAESTQKPNKPIKRIVGVFAIVLGLVAASFVVFILMIPIVGPHRIDPTRVDAMTLRSAAELYMASGHANCPSIRELVAERVISASTRTQDPWGNDFVIECRGNEFTVSSNGPDGQRGTEDDISTN